AQLQRHEGNRLLEDLGEPAVRDDGLRERSPLLALEVRAEAPEVVQQAPRLVLLDVKPGQREQAPLMVTGLDDMRRQTQPELAVDADQLDLLHVEPQGVQPAQPVVDAEALVRAEDLLARQLAPEAVVAAADLDRGLDRVEIRR